MYRKFQSKKFFSIKKKIFSVEFFFSKFEFVILIEPPFNPQNDFSYRRPCKTHLFCGKGSNYNL